MANNCDYELKAVSKDKSSLERLVKIMKYEDDEFYINRCFNACPSDIKEEEGGYFSISIFGDCAWSCGLWFSVDGDNPSNKIVTGRDSEGRDIYGTAHYSAFPHICKVLGISLELYSQEPGCQFQEHGIVNPISSGIERVDWCGWSRSEVEEMDESERLDYGIDEAEYGYGDDYGVFMSASELVEFVFDGESEV